MSAESRIWHIEKKEVDGTWRLANPVGYLLERHAKGIAFNLSSVDGEYRAVAYVHEAESFEAGRAAQREADAKLVEEQGLSEGCHCERCEYTKILAAVIRKGEGL